MLDKKIATTREARDYIIDALRRELVGPSPGYPLVQLNREEILRQQDPPRYRYSCGILFPRGMTYSRALDASEDAAGIDAAPEVESADAGSAEDEPEISSSAPEDKAAETDVEVDPSSMFLPSTMGLSFLAKVSGGIHVEASWGTYHKKPVPDFPTYRNDGKPAELWFRTPGSRTIDLSSAELGLGDRIIHIRRRHVSPPGLPSSLELDVVSRPWGDGLRLLTLTLLNAGQNITPVNENCFFQCELRAQPLETSAILPYPDRPAATQDDEEASMALLYRHRPNYAVGHGCAADWSLADDRVVFVRSETLPAFEQPPVLPVESLGGVELSMKRLAEGSLADVAASCRALAKAYKQWIEDRTADLAGDSQLPARLRERGRAHLAACRKCLERILDGVSLLESDDEAFHAFQLMNRAMLEQRAHYALSADDDKRRSWVAVEEGGAIMAKPSAPYAQPSYPEATRWRPFQLAFVLMNVRSFVDPRHLERALVDIIWFPTGGGKTEAYLGLAAFGIVLRRLRNPEDAGTNVLMRYTLRLLTTQQFQRAASLICALELVRRKDPTRFGSVPVSIGLWLGSSVTPNNNDKAVAEFRRMEREGGDNPFIVLSCPWCGIDMGPREFGRGIRLFGYRKEKRIGGGERVRFVCEDPDCPFSDHRGLPLEVVDEALYEQPPTMLIGTVDKFAMMPWNPDARKLFGIDNPYAKAPPDLIIQDELHLISGPLGSMVGHYETVIDEFCTVVSNRARIPPKIVASTATIARSGEQVRAVYGRDSVLFPPQGLRAGESFFAREGTSDAGRTYVGVLTTALPSHVTAQVRTLATLLQAPSNLDGPPGEIDRLVDPYWTLVVYFNSLRELGRASTLVQADIREYLNAVWDRTGVGAVLASGGPDRRRFVNRFDELTSRMRSSDIPAVLQKLFTAKPSRETVDLCYATNMIQVGLDVPRLSIMSIVGQPKGASEYIQASSRVGRGAGKPGLVITNFNPFKPRDRSHFESFRAFHENAYRHVEPTSVTPFSIPVCERAIHALAVTIARFRYPDLRNSPHLGIDDARRAEITATIMDRVKTVDPGELGRARATLDRFLADWNRRKPQYYGDMSNSTSDPLLRPAGTPLRADLAYLGDMIRQTATSMRNVDADCEAVPIPNYPDPAGGAA